jgi:hypothetical protein
VIAKASERHAFSDDHSEVILRDAGRCNIAVPIDLAIRHQLNLIEARDFTDCL